MQGLFSTQPVHEGFYSSYASQSLVIGFHFLSITILEGKDCADLVAKMELQVQFFAGASFDTLRPTAISSGAVIAALCHVLKHDW